jgi:hypothetical protein
MPRELQVAEVTGAAEPGCRRAKLSKAQQPTNQPATWKHLPSQPTSNCQPPTTSASDPSFDFNPPLHHATNSIAPEHQLSTSSVTAAASRSNLQNDGRLVSRSWAGLFPSKHAGPPLSQSPTSTPKPPPLRQHIYRTASTCAMVFRECLTNNAVSAALFTRLVPSPPCRNRQLAGGDDVGSDFVSRPDRNRTQTHQHTFSY